MAAATSDRELRLECARLAAVFSDGDRVVNADRLYRFVTRQQAGLLTLDQVLELLRARGRGKQAAIAREAEVSDEYVSRVMRGQVPPSEKLLRLVGYRKVEQLYEPEPAE